MFKKKTIYLIIVILLAVCAALLYFYWPDQQTDIDKIYTAEDFPNALQMMDQEIFQIQLEGLSTEYSLLKQGEKPYDRWINIGLLKKRMGDIDGAKEAWLEAISKDPNQHHSYGNLANLYFYDYKEYEKAEEYFLKALDINKGKGYYMGLADLYRYKLIEKRNQVEDLIIEAADMAPDRISRADYYVYLAKFFEKEENDMVKAKSYAQKAVESNPEVESQVENLL